MEGMTSIFWCCGYSENEINAKTINEQHNSFKTEIVKCGAIVVVFFNRYGATVF